MQFSNVAVDEVKSASHAEQISSFRIVISTTNTWMIFHLKFQAGFSPEQTIHEQGSLYYQPNPNYFALSTREISWNYHTFASSSLSPSTRVASNDPCLLTTPAQQPLFLHAKLLHIFPNNSTYTLSTWALRGFLGKYENPKKPRAIHHRHWTTNFGGIKQYTPAPSKGCQWNPKGW